MTRSGTNSRSLRGLRFSRRFVPAGRRIVPYLPERPTRAYLSFVFKRWPSLWGLEHASKRLRRARDAYQSAFPWADTNKFIAVWARARGEGLATSLLFLARWLIGRPSRFVQPACNLKLPTEGAFLVAALHYSIDPAVQLCCVTAGSRQDLLWAVYPLQPTVEDDRELWLTGTPVPTAVTRMFLPVTDRGWIVKAASHLRRGGGVFVAIDAPFDSTRPAANSIAVGDTSIPVSPSVEVLAQIRSDVGLYFAAPVRGRSGGWTVELRRVANLEELTAAAERWIVLNRLHWAGWPHVLWRDDAETMRRKVGGANGRARP